MPRHRLLVGEEIANTSQQVDKGCGPLGVSVLAMAPTHVMAPADLLFVQHWTVKLRKGVILGIAESGR